MDKKIFGSICLVLGIAIIVSTGASFAYFNASTSNEGNISGTTVNFDVNLNLTTIHQSTNMIPLQDTLVATAISGTNKCVDTKGYEVCSLYKITLTNDGDPFVLNGYLKTSSTTYTTGNLKYQIYDTNYNAISDVMTPSLTTNEKVYFTKDSNMVTTSMNHNDTEYYLVMWITETNTLQNADYSKNYTGLVGFETLSGERIEATFTT
ncbi:MAG: hypothetical protein ACI310_04400 [Bacilli bacterium]